MQMYSYPHVTIYYTFAYFAYIGYSPVMQVISKEVGGSDRGMSVPRSPFRMERRGRLYQPNNSMRMKKITSIAVAITFLLPTAIVSAAVDCSIDNCGNGNPEMITNVWGGTNSSVPHVAAGATVYDEAGIGFPVPAWLGSFVMLDITRTDYYRNQARDTARQLQERGFALGQYSYWLTH
jgi:hypothetical protein